MNSWKYVDDEEIIHHTGRKINKNKFCKKNKLGGGKYGSHIYEGTCCKFCGKINPVIKKQPINIKDENM